MLFKNCLSGKQPTMLAEASLFSQYMKGKNWVERNDKIAQWRANCIFSGSEYICLTLFKISVKLNWL